MNEFDYDNKIVELSDDTTKEDKKIVEEEFLDVQPSKTKKKKRSFKDKWNDLAKKQKTMIIVCSVIVLLLIVALILYFVVFKKDNDSTNPDGDGEQVILEKDNYRYENGSLVFLNLSDREIGRYECTNKDMNKCYVAKLDYSTDTFERIINVTEDGKEIEKNSQIYYDKYVFVQDGNNLFIYNIETKEKDLDLNSIKSYNANKNLVVVEDNTHKYGLVEIKENGYEYLIRPSYDNLGVVNLELAYLVAQEKDAYYVLDSTGKKLSSDFKNTKIKSLSKDYIVGEVGSSYNLFDYKYDNVASDYDYISIHDEVIALVKNNRLYLMDAELNKLNEDGIRLENKNYVKKYVYDSNNKLVETLKSYEVEVSGNTVTIRIGKDTKDINILEGKVSSNFEYFSYLDGKLYFYGDNDKVDIIGTYTCTNKNNITSNTSTYTNCSVYTNNEGMSGVYNNEYVFIYDNANNGSIYYLYDLKTNKNRGTYTSLEFVKKSEISSDLKPIYTSSSFIIAKSGTGANNGNYGVLEISSDKVAGKIEFKYKKIENVYDYYLLINVDDSYSLYDSNFNKVSNEFEFIEAYENYYVGISNSKLNVYRYNNALGILESDLEISGSEFEIDFTDGFNITINGLTYSYNLEGKVKDGE